MYRINPSFERVRRSVTLYIIIVTVILYAFQNITRILFGTDLLLYFGAKINQFIFAGQFWRFITPVFLHGSLLHIGFNMYALYSIGPSLERRYGTRSFLLLYFFGGIFGNIFSFLFSANISLGSSTAIFGLIAAQAVYIYKNRVLLGSAANLLLRNVLMMIAINLVLGLSPGIDNWGHLGGLVGGFLFAWFAGPSYGISENVFGENVIVRENKREIVVIGGLVLLAILLVLIRFALL
jgi:rhomboid protease GluP